MVDDLIEGIRMGLIERKRNVPHLKTFATSGNGDFNKASLIGVDYDTEYAQEFLRDHKNMRMIINARAVCESRPLARLMDDALDEVCDKYDLDCQVFFTECFGTVLSSHEQPTGLFGSCGTRFVNAAAAFAWEWLPP